MLSSVLLSGAVILGVLAGEGAPARPPDLDAYKSAAARARRDPEAQVRLALWCEAHGLAAERLKHLSLAVLSDPTSTLARGLMGLIAFHGKWERPDQISRVVQNDPQHKARIKEYLERRARAPDRADDQWKLALWCEQSDLKQQATAHLFRVLQLDPSRDAAWKHLGYKKLGGRWDKPERVAAAKAEAQQQHQANNHWKPILEKLVNGLDSKDKARRAQAASGLADLHDPRAVPMVWVIFVKGGEQHQTVAVRLLAQIDSPGSSRALALLILRTRSAEVKRKATQVLMRRDPRDFASVLVALLRDPVKYEVRPVNGPGSPGELLVKQKDMNVRRRYSPLSAPSVSLMPNDQFSQDVNGLPVVIRELGFSQTEMVKLGYISDSAGMAAASAMFGGSNANAAPNVEAMIRAGLPAGLSEAMGAKLSQDASKYVKNLGGPAQDPLFAAGIINHQMQIPIGQMMVDSQNSALTAQRQLDADVKTIDAYNAQLTETNQQIRQILSEATGNDLGLDRTAWDKWLVDLSGYAFAAERYSDDPPTYIEEVPISYQPEAAPPIMINQEVGAVIQRHHSCFGAGTAVRTLDGTVAIEKLRAGDLVLTQSPKTGELKYQPIMTAYHNPPNATLRIDMGNETIVATGIHRFWKAGRGWIMARDLKPGDALRALGGRAVVKSVQKERVQPVFNLQVAEGESFFVGDSGVLAHDNSLVSPTPSPFDAVPELETSAAPSVGGNHGP